MFLVLLEATTQTTSDIDKWVEIVDNKGFPWLISLLFIFFLSQELIRKQKKESEDDELKRRLKENLEKLMIIEKEVEAATKSLEDLKLTQRDTASDIDQINLLIERISGSISSITFISKAILEEMTDKRTTQKIYKNAQNQAKETMKEFGGDEG